MAETRTCPKCGSEQVTTRYHEAGDSGNYGGLAWRDYRVKERECLIRHCTSCSYEWATDCLDATPPTAALPEKP